MKNDKNVKLEYLKLKAENEREEAELIEKYGSIIPPRPIITLAALKPEPEEKD